MICSEDLTGKRLNTEGEHITNIRSVDNIILRNGDDDKLIELTKPIKGRLKNIGKTKSMCNSSAENTKHWRHRIVVLWMK